MGMTEDARRLTDERLAESDARAQAARDSVVAWTDEVMKCAAEFFMAARERRLEPPYGSLGAFRQKPAFWVVSVPCGSRFEDYRGYFPFCAVAIDLQGRVGVAKAQDKRKPRERFVWKEFKPPSGPQASPTEIRAAFVEQLSREMEAKSNRAGKGA